MVSPKEGGCRFQANTSFRGLTKTNRLRAVGVANRPLASRVLAPQIKTGISEDDIFVSLRTSEIHLFYNLQLFYWHFLEILWLFIFLVLYLLYSIIRNANRALSLQL